MTRRQARRVKSSEAWPIEYLQSVERKAATVIYSDKARALQRLVWKEVINELKANVPELQATLDGL
jgi:hypothetical protein